MDVRPEPRISDDDREATARRLARAYAEGRIGVTEFETRLDWVLESTGASQLDEATRDLPPAESSALAAPTPGRASMRIPIWFGGPFRLLDLLVLLTAPVLILTLLVAVNVGTFIWPGWLWALCAAPIVVWVLEPTVRRL